MNSSLTRAHSNDTRYWSSKVHVCECCTYDLIVTSISRSLSRSTNGNRHRFSSQLAGDLFLERKKTRQCEIIKANESCFESFLVNARYMIIANTYYIRLRPNEDRKNFRHFYVLFMLTIEWREKKECNLINRKTR